MLTATRLTGPAPLAVLFDAIGTTSTLSALPFHDLTYSFNFSDPTSGNWSITGAPKNVQVGGPLAAHVFDLPGTYVVTMTASMGAASSTTSVTVTVTDPATHWAGTQTIVVSTTGNFAGAPAGSEQRTTLPTSYDGKRVLLRRGETFGSITMAHTVDNALVGAFGTGAKPVLGSVTLDGSTVVADFPDEITVMDLELRGGFSLSSSGSRILLYRCDIDTPVDSDAQVDISTAIGFYVANGTLPASSYYWPREIFLVENIIEGDTNGDGHPNIAAMGSFMKSAILGNSINKATEHSLRIWATNRTVIANNLLGGEHYAPNPPGIRGAMKIHSSGTAAYDDNIQTSGLNVATRHLVIANNRVGTQLYPGSWVGGVGPQNSDPGTVEASMDIIYENNVHTRGPFQSQDFHVLALRCTTRGNSATSGGPFNGDAVTASEWSGDPGMLPYLGDYFGQLQ